MKTSRLQFFSLVTVMATVTLAVTGIAIWIIYQTSVDQNALRLSERVHLVARELQTLRESGKDLEQHLQRKQGLTDDFGLGQAKSWEILVARQENREVRVLYRHRHGNHHGPSVTPPGHSVGLAMRRALAGEQGTIIAEDYSGALVQAAFAYVEGPGLGVVAQVNMQELRAPFVRAGLITVASALVLVLLGSLILNRTSCLWAKQLARSEERFRALAESCPVGVFEATPDGEALYANAKLRAIAGFSAPVVNTRHATGRLHPEDKEEVLAQWLAAKAAGKNWLRECRILNGTDVRWIRIQAAPLPFHGQFPGYVGTVEDITDARKALEQSATLARIVEQNHESVLITNTDGRIEYVNAAFERATGYARQEVIGQNPRILKSGQHRPEFYRQLWATLLRGDEWYGRLFNKRRDDSMLVEDCVLFPIRDSAGKTTNYVGIKRDVTVQHQLEEQLRQAQKMEAVGRLAGGVAHDFNNLLGVILGYAELILGRMQNDNPLHAKITEIRQAADRAAALTKQLLAFSRRQVLQVQPLNLNVVVMDLQKMLGRLIGEDIQLEIHEGADLGLVNGDKSQIEQVIMNLAVNARDAMPKGGKLIIETQNEELDQQYAATHRSVKPGHYIKLAVTDTGQGMDQETQARLFEPFFTTKELGKGTGLGLATVYGIVKQSGGFIWVYSEVGQGSTFKIYLPRVEGSDSPPPKKRTEPTALKGRETILLVEDSDSFREFVREGLATAGYTVLEARSAAQALQLSADHPEPIQLLLTDMVMPQMGGRELANRLCTSQPRLQVIFMSGYTNDVALQQGLRNSQRFIQKPFNLADLLQVIQSSLGARNVVSDASVAQPDRRKGEGAM